MNRWQWSVLGLITAALVAVSAYLGISRTTTGERIPGLKNPENLTLYSIDGTENQKANQTEATEFFASYPVLGRIDVKSQADRTKLVAALQDAIANNDGVAAKCFWPRHAILAVEKGKTFEIVICFQCKQFMLNGNGFPWISKRPEPIFNDYLRRNGIAIAP